MKKNSILLFCRIWLFLLLLISQAAVHATAAAEKSPYYDVQLVTKKAPKSHIATVKVTGKAGYHCNTEYRWKLSVKPGPGIVVSKKILKNNDAKQFTEEAVIFDVPYDSGPKQNLFATLKFSVCNEKLCLIEKIPLSWKSGN